MHIYGPLLEGETYRLQGTGGKQWIAVKKIIGRGGFGVIYLVEDEAENEYVLKFLGAECNLQDEGSVDELCREYGIEECAKTKRITKVYRKLIKAYGGKYQSFQDEIEFLMAHAQEYVIPIEPMELRGIQCYRMPYYRTTMAQKINYFKVTDPDDRDLLKFLIACWKVACVLQKIHVGGLVHRDIKPENIFFENEWEEDNCLEDWQPLVGDFGVAKEAEKTGYWTAVGDKRYMAPEQKLGTVKKEDAHKCDVYALGRILQEIPACARTFPGLAKIIENAVAEDSAQRYQSDEMAGELKKLLKPTVEELLSRLCEHKDWDHLSRWVDMCWDLLGHSTCEKLIVKRFEQQFGEPLRLRFHHKIKPQADASDEIAWQLCVHVFGDSLDGVVPLCHLQSKGRNRYLVAAKTEPVPFPLHEDSTLLEMAVQIERSLDNIATAGFAPAVSSLDRESFCLATGQIALIPWRIKWAYRSKVPESKISRAMAATLLDFWVGEKVGAGWRPDSRFYDQKYNNGWVDREYLDAITQILLKGAFGFKSGMGLEWIQELIEVYCIKNIEKLRDRYQLVVDKINSHAYVIMQQQDNEDIDPYSYPEFYKSCEKLLNVLHDNPVERNALTESQCREEKNRLKALLKLLQKKNNIDVESEMPDIFRPLARNTLAELKKFRCPLQMHKIDACDFSVDALMEFTGENAREIKVITEKKQHAFYLLRQKDLRGHLPLSQAVEHKKFLPMEAERLIIPLIEMKKQIDSLLKRSDDLGIGDIYLSPDGSLYYDWCQKGAQSSTPWSDLLAYLLYKDRLGAKALRIPLLCERYPSKQTLSEEFLQVLLAEHPILNEIDDSELTRHFQALPAGACWKCDFIETVERSRMCEILHGIEMLRFHYGELVGFTATDDFVEQVDFLIAETAALREKLSGKSQGAGLERFWSQWEL